MIDTRFFKILELSNQIMGSKPAVIERESEFSALSREVFLNPPDQPVELENYGFGLKNPHMAVFPYCILAHSDHPIDDLKAIDGVANLLTRIGSYPILAGSSVFLGIDHELCEDVDLVHYVTIGTKPEERAAAAQELRRLVDDLQPDVLTSSQSTLGDGRPMPWRSALGTKRIRLFLDQLVGSDPLNPDPDRVASIEWCQLAWSGKTYGLEKELTLQIHFVHQSFADKDIHPYQELHECSPENFIHTNKSWLAPSFLFQFWFLKRSIEEQFARANILKAAKRAVIFLGFVGNMTVRDELLALLVDYVNLDAEGQRQSEVKMDAIISELKRSTSEALQDGEIA